MKDVIFMEWIRALVIERVLLTMNNFMIFKFSFLLSFCSVLIELTLISIYFYTNTKMQWYKTRWNKFRMELLLYTATKNHLWNHARFDQAIWRALIPSAFQRRYRNATEHCALNVNHNLHRTKWYLLLIDRTARRCVCVRFWSHCYRNGRW